MKKITALLLTTALLMVCLFSFSAFAEADNEQYLYKEGAGVATGWWFHDGAGIRTTHYVAFKFTAKGNVNGFTSYFLASQTAVTIKCSLLKEDGTVIASNTADYSGDGEVTITFDKVAAAGVLILRIESLTDADGSHFVVASSDAPDSGVVAEIDSGAATNESTKAAPYVKLSITTDAADAGSDSGSGSDTPATGEASIVIAAVAAVSLAGVVVCKKVKA